MLTEAEYVLVAREVKARTGGALTREMSAAAELKLQPVARREGFGSVSELISAARIRPDGRLWTQIADALLAADTRFFRDRAQFARIADTLLPEALQRRGHERVRIWCAGCSTGQEAYSIAMILEGLREQGLNPAAEILATDISERLIEKARAGLYTQFEVQRGLPIRKLITYFEKTGDLWRISDRLRAAVRFDTHNLLKHPGALGQFDIILFAHVLPHLDPELRAPTLARVADALAPDGRIVLGEGEALPEGSEGFVCAAGIVARSAVARAAA